MGPHASPFPEDIRAALDAIRRIVKGIRTSTREAESIAGLSSAQLFALHQLASAPGSSVNDLAARTFTHQSSVSAVVQRLVARRLVAKLPALEDRRRVRLTLTEAGRALVRRSPEPLQERLIAGIARLSATERQVLTRALNAIALTMGVADQRPPMFFDEERRRGRRKMAR
jgi:DNA-binding MarR family transcriptional regulator